MSETLTCPYCGREAQIGNGTAIYGSKHSNRWYWICAAYPDCDAYVGCHPKTNIPLGTLANKELREWRMKVHAKLDWIWRTKLMKRSELYSRLASAMLIPEHECHVGMFSVLRCKAALDCIRRILRERKTKKELSL